MRFSPTILLLFAMQGCGSGLQSANEVDGRSQKQDIDTNVENKSSPATPTAEPVETQEQAIAAIRKLNGEVTIDEKSPNKPVIGVDLHSTKITDDGLIEVTELFQLQSLNLNGTNITDEVLVLKQAKPLCFS